MPPGDVMEPRSAPANTVWPFPFTPQECTFTSQYGVVALHTLPIMASNCPEARSPAPTPDAWAPTVSADRPAGGMAGSTSGPSYLPHVAEPSGARPRAV